MAPYFRDFGRAYEAARLSKKNPYSSVLAEKPAIALVLGRRTGVYNGKNEHSLNNDKIVTKSCKSVFNSKFRPQRQQAAGPLYHTGMDLSSIIFSSFCTKKRVSPGGGHSFYQSQISWVALYLATVPSSRKGKKIIPISNFRLVLLTISANRIASMSASSIAVCASMKSHRSE